MMRMRIQNMCCVQVLNTKEAMDEQQIIREEQGNKTENVKQEPEEKNQNINTAGKA